MRLHLQPKDFEVLDFIIQYKKDNDGCAPTLREICVACRISSISQADMTLMRLAMAEKISLAGSGTSRNIRVNGGKWTYAKPKKASK